VYFIQSGLHGPIKIGYTVDVVDRLADLQIGSPTLLRLIATTPGGFAVERQWHQRFADERLLGEWFAPSDRLLATIKEGARSVVPQIHEKRVSDRRKPRMPPGRYWLLATRLFARMDERPDAFSTAEELSKLTGVHRARVVTCLGYLQKRGWLETTHVPGRAASAYRRRAK
jgi:hypothetical protein